MTGENFVVDPENNVNSFSRLTPVNYEGTSENPLPNVWKVFSQEPLTENDMNKIFLDRKQVEVCDWLGKYFITNLGRILKLMCRSCFSFLAKVHFITWYLCLI